MAETGADLSATCLMMTLNFIAKALHYHEY